MFCVLWFKLSGNVFDFENGKTKILTDTPTIGTLKQLKGRWTYTIGTQYFIP